VTSTLRGFVADVPIGLGAVHAVPIDLGAVHAVPIDLGTIHGNRPRSGDRQLDPRACDGNNFERQVATWNYDLFANPSAENEHSISPEQASDTFFPTRTLKSLTATPPTLFP
jgi:hypothetical protein